MLELETARMPEKVQELRQFASVYYSPEVTPADSTYPAPRGNLFHMGRQLD